MESVSPQSQLANDRHQGKGKLTCTLHGCKRLYSEPQALERHLQEHEIPAQSLSSKVLLCSSVGCSGSFADMQKLMEHMRRHHKLNIFFQCENCRTKLRSYRGLLTHLHSCSKVGRGKPKAAEATPTSPAVASSSVSSASEQQPQPESASAAQGGSTLEELPPAPPQTDSSAAPLSPVQVSDVHPQT